MDWVGLYYEHIHVGSPGSVTRSNILEKYSSCHFDSLSVAVRFPCSGGVFFHSSEFAASSALNGKREFRIQPQQRVKLHACFIRSPAIFV